MNYKIVRNGEAFKVVNERGVAVAWVSDSHLVDDIRDVLVRYGVEDKRSVHKCEFEIGG